MINIRFQVIQVTIGSWQDELDRYEKPAYTGWVVQTDAHVRLECFIFISSLFLLK